MLEYTSGFNHNPAIWAMLRVDEQTGITKITPHFRQLQNDSIHAMVVQQNHGNK